MYANVRAVLSVCLGAERNLGLLAFLVEQVEMGGSIVEEGVQSWHEVRGQGGSGVGRM